MNQMPAHADKGLREALERFVVDNSDLERLESLVTQFNVFEAIGAVRHELRHSDFLAYLLSPYQNHGLGDSFARRLLQRAVSFAGDVEIPLTAIHLDTGDFGDLEVLREWQNVDILLKSDSNHFVVLIENKIDTTEHSDQLAKYLQEVRKQFPSHGVLAIYLTPDGREASHPNFISFDYEEVAATIEGLLVSKASTLGPDVRTLMSHYAQMLRRHIVAESEIADLCRRIYRKHTQAIKLIVEHIPDQQTMIRDLLDQLISAQPDLVLDYPSKQLIRFALKAWEIPALHAEPEWHRSDWHSGRMLLFEFQNQADSLKLKLIVGPGPTDIRDRLLQIALRNQPPFKPATKSLNKYWNEIYSYDFLSPKAYSGVAEEVTARVEERWKHFLSAELPLIAKFKWDD
jgi:PD-(D/E)XK nuclease superfamily